MKYFNCFSPDYYSIGYESSYVKEEYNNSFFLGVDFNNKELIKEVSTFLDNSGLNYKTDDVVNLFTGDHGFIPKTEFTFVLSKEEYGLFKLLAEEGKYSNTKILLTYKGWE